MTPSQMLRRIKPVETRPPLTRVYDAVDWATSAGLSVYACIMQRTCPICGSKGKLEGWMGDDRIQHFYCNEVGTHVYEHDKETDQIDRVPY